MKLNTIWISFCFVIIQAAAEKHDFITVYRFMKNGYSSQVSTELHRQTNAVGLPLRTRNGFFIDSVEGMPPLKCSLAIEDCEWNKIGNWIYSEVDVSEDTHLSINIDEDGFNLHGYYKTCNQYNGGCDVFCSMIANGPECICPNGAEVSLQRSDMSCIPVSSSTTFITSSTIFNKTNLVGEKFYYWYFIPPTNASLHLDLEIKGSSRSYTSAEEILRNGQTKHLFTDFVITKKIIESKNIVKVYYRRERHYNNYRQDDCHLSGCVEFKRKHLTLNEEFGKLTYNINPVAESICVSIIYKSKVRSALLDFYVIFQNGTNIHANNFLESKIGDWKQKRFYVTLGDLNSSVILSLSVSGSGTVIYSINGCSPYGNQDVTVTNHRPLQPSDVVASIQGRRDTEQSISAQTVVATNLHQQNTPKCFHSGRFNSATGECECVIGFTGNKCEEGCGPNFYGNDCSVTCSDFQWGCSGMLFCKPHLPCRCAPGYKGPGCDIECTEGMYGPNCLHVCGNCKHTHCDIFTGVCHSGCKSGLRPPLCAIPYKYAKEEPSITYQDMKIVTISLNLSETNGEGDIKYYQIQYYNKEDTQNDWIELQPRKPKESIIRENITGLLPGRNYALRVVLFDSDGSSYQDNLIPTKTLLTSCTEPRSTKYNINHDFRNFGFQVYWQYDINATDCPITGYTIILRRNWRQVEFNTRMTYINFQNLLAGTEYQVKVKAKTQTAGAPFSSWYTVVTSDAVPLYVSNLRAIANGNRKLLVSWDPPKYTAGSLNKYAIRYKCIQFLSCSDIRTETEDETMVVSVNANETSIILKELHSHAVYVVEVAGVTGDFTGPFTTIQGSTDDSRPDVAPLISNHPVVSSTNTTITVQWIELENCSLINGYLVGYHYELLAPNNSLMRKGETRVTCVTFDDLIPQTTYHVNVYIISSGGWNEDKKNTITASTKATVPDKVENLIVYKRGRRVIGLRWSSPINTYGTISSFLLSHCEAEGDCKTQVTHRISPVSCSAWPNQFCFTITKLLPNKEYLVSVRARNNEVDEDGDSATLTTITSEGVPPAPLELRVLKQTYRSVTLEWKPPLVFNGILRSFLINVEHIDSANSSNCCTYFLLQEALTQSENESYVFEVLGLSPASKYTIGISSKTISIGPSSTLTVNTQPEVPEFHPPQMLDDTTVLLPEQEEYLGLSSTYLLMILPENENTSSVIYDEEMMKQFQEVVIGNFYVVGEYNNEDFPFTVKLGSGEEPQEGTFGVLQNRETPEKFRVGLAIVLEYNGAKSVGFAARDSQRAETN